MTLISCALCQGKLQCRVLKSFCECGFGTEFAVYIARVPEWNMEHACSQFICQNSCRLSQLLWAPLLLLAKKFNKCRKLTNMSRGCCGWCGQQADRWTDRQTYERTDRETDRYASSVLDRRSRWPLVYYHVIDSTLVRRRVDVDDSSSCGFNVLHLMTRLKPTPAKTAATTEITTTVLTAHQSQSGLSACRAPRCPTPRLHLSLYPAICTTRLYFCCD